MTQKAMEEEAINNPNEKTPHIYNSVKETMRQNTEAYGNIKIEAIDKYPDFNSVCKNCMKLESTCWLSPLY